MTDPTKDPRFLAAIDLLRRTGMSEFQIRYQDDPEPVVWIALGMWNVTADGQPVPLARSDGRYFDASAGMNPLSAILRLAERMLDGGECAHCHRPASVTDDWQREMPLSDAVCWYVFDPERATYRRSCEAEVP